MFTDVSTDQRCKVVAGEKLDSVIIQLLSINSRLQPVKINLNHEIQQLNQKKTY